MPPIPTGYPEAEQNDPEEDAPWRRKIFKKSAFDI
jgi:hypothetical protein